MSIYGAGESNFAPLSGEDGNYAVFNDIEVNGNIYLKEPFDIYTGFNIPLITSDKATDDVIFNTTTTNSNFKYTVGTGQDTYETIFSVNPTTGLGFEVNNNHFQIGWDELSYLNGARSNLQQQIDVLSPDLTNNDGYWATVWNMNDLTNNTSITQNKIPFTNIDASSNGITYNGANPTRLVIENEGIYMFIATYQVKHTSANKETFYGWIQKNGNNVASTGFKEELSQTTKLVCANWQLPCAAGDYIEFAWKSTDANMTLEHFQSDATMPVDIPSVIITASQITYFQSIEAEVNDILQRITGLTYNPVNGRTTIANDLSCNNLITSKITATDISSNRLEIKDTVVINNSGLNINFKAGTTFDLESQIFTYNTYVSPENVSYISGLSSNAQTQLNNKVDLTSTQYITGRKYFTNTDVSGVLNVKVPNQNNEMRNVVDYINEQVNVAYQRANLGIDKADAAQNTANNALDTANNANDTANGALSLASGASAGLAALTGVVAQQGSDIAALAGVVAGQQGQIDAIDEQILELEGKTQFQTCNVATTTTSFAGSLSTTNFYTSYINNLPYVPFNPLTFFAQF